MCIRDSLRTGNRNITSVGRSSFFAYNPIALNQGQTEFRKTWNERVLEDNWRRSLRSDATSASLEDEINEADEELTITDEQIDAFLRGVPRSPTQKKAAQVKIYNALFNLGIQFRERLRNHEKAIEVLERLVNEYPEFEKRDEALFYLYQSQDALNTVSYTHLTLPTILLV